MSTFIDNFSWRVYDGVGVHTGLDLSAAAETKIKSISVGSSVTTGFNNSEGNYVHMYTSSGLYVRYIHMYEESSLGSTVKQGDIIGKVGSTGNSSGDHLHIDISNTQYIDPLAFFG